MNSYAPYALVTGASSGIGKAIAEELARRKINLMLVALAKTGLSELAQRIRETEQVHVEIHETDLTQEHAAGEVASWCREKGVRIHILVNNVGIGNKRSFESTAINDLELMMKLNNNVLIRLTHHFISDLKVASPGYILNVGSLASFMSIPGKAVYSASKSFTYSFSLALRAELRHMSISVSCLCPGGTLTSQNVINNGQNVRFAGRVMYQLPEEVAGVAIRDLFRGKCRIIPGLLNKFLFRLWSILPQFWVEWILSMLFMGGVEEQNVRRVKRIRMPARNGALLYALAVN